MNLDLTDAAYDTFLDVVAVLDALAGYTCVIGNAEFNAWLTTTIGDEAATDITGAGHVCTFAGTDVTVDLTAGATDILSEVVSVLNALGAYTCTIADAEFNTWPAVNLDGIVVGETLVGAAYTFGFTGPCVTYILAAAANDTVGEVVTLLNARTGITCAITHADYANWPTTSLVAMTAQDITGAGHTALYTGTDLDYDLTAGTSDIISEVVALIHAKADYTCTIASTDFNTRDAALLDAIAAQDIYTAAFDVTWSGGDLSYDLTLAANDTVAELAALITAKSTYSAASLSSDYDALDTVDLTDIAAEDITTSINLVIPTIEHTFDTSNASYDTYAELTAAIDALDNFMAVVGPGTVGTDDSGDLAALTATTLSGSESLTTAAGDVVLSLATVVAAEFQGAKDWLDANVPGSHGEVVLWPFNFYQEITATPRAALAAAALAAGITIGRSAQLYQRNGAGANFVDPGNSYEGGCDIYNTLGDFMVRTNPTPQAADDHVKHILTWARINGCPVSFLGHYSATALDPNITIIDAYTKAIQKYGRYVPLASMAVTGSAHQVRTAPYEYSPPWKNTPLVPAPQAHSSLTGEGRIIAGIHAVAGHTDALAQTYPRLQAQAFGFRAGGETEWSAQRKLAFFVDGAPAETIAITTWAITPSVSGAQSLIDYDTIGDVIDRLITLGYTVLTHVQCVRSLPATHLELVTAGTSIASGLWVHYYPAEIQPSIGAIERVVRLGQPKEHWRR